MRQRINQEYLPVGMSERERRTCWKSPGTWSGQGLRQMAVSIGLIE